MSWTGSRRGRVDRFEPPVAELVPWEWEKQPGESWVAFMAFQVWLDLERDLGGRRTLRRAAELEGKSLNLLKRWSHRWRWRERARLLSEHSYREYRRRLRWARERERERERKLERLEAALDTVGLDLYDLEALGLERGALELLLDTR